MKENIRENTLIWLAAALVAFLILSLVINPLLHHLTGSETPIVTVMSESMEHRLPFGEWWPGHKAMYEKRNITKEEFASFPFVDGLNTGDLVIVDGKRPEEIVVGDVLVFQNQRGEVIIHRVVERWTENESGEEKVFFCTKGDNHHISIDARLFNERRIPEEDVRGVAAFVVPLLGMPRVMLGA